MRLLPLGAGHDVGRSCILVTMGGRNIMFDCGAHMEFSDERRCGRGRGDGRPSVWPDVHIASATQVPRLRVHRRKGRHQQSDRLCDHIALPSRPRRFSAHPDREIRLLRTDSDDVPDKVHRVHPSRRLPEGLGRALRQRSGGGVHHRRDSQLYAERWDDHSAAAATDTLCTDGPCMSVAQSRHWTCGRGRLWSAG